MNSMDAFRTQVLIPEVPAKISYHTKCMFMGSCFADSMGNILAGYKFPALLNPFGTLFNPASIAANLQFLIDEKTFGPEDLHHHNGLWLSFSHYTGYSHPNPETCLSDINRSATTAAAWLKQCHYLLLTFGTAWAYTHNQTGRLVANCHKIPSSEFTRVFIGPASMVAQYDALITSLRKINPGLRIIFTLSPVRHWSNGAINNQRSKSVLHYSIHEIMQLHEQVFYFPAYEIFMDELRDYRFYATDMFHPSEQGVNYVWDRFCDTWIEEPAKKIMTGVAAVIKAASHRPLHKLTTNHEKFRLNTLKKIDELTERYPFLDFTNEKAQLRSP